MGEGPARQAAPVTRSCVICATPRSGSTLLCDSLTLTGIAGNPLEYFCALLDRRFAERLGWYSTDDAEYVRRVLALGTTPNGVFGVKLHWHQLAATINLLRRLLPVDSSTESQVLARVFPNPSYIWLRRQDKIAEAISYYRAILTGHWGMLRDSSSPPAIPARSVEFDFQKIQYLANLCVSSDRGWASYFEAYRVAPLVVVYEDFIGSHERTVRSVLRHLGLSPHGGAIASPRLRRQADQLSAEWMGLFRETAERRGIGIQNLTELDGPGGASPQGRTAPANPEFA
jgi:trehalose 2-sulfotransferase